MYGKGQKIKTRQQFQVAFRHRHHRQFHHHVMMQRRHLERLATSKENLFKNLQRQMGAQSFSENCINRMAGSNAHHWDYSDIHE
jgi:hypothetical protein